MGIKIEWSTFILSYHPKFSFFGETLVVALCGDLHILDTPPPTRFEYIPRLLFRKTINATRHCLVTDRGWREIIHIHIFPRFACVPPTIVSQDYKSEKAWIGDMPREEVQNWSIFHPSLVSSQSRHFATCLLEEVSTFRNSKLALAFENIPAWLNLFRPVVENLGLVKEKCFCDLDVFNR